LARSGVEGLGANLGMLRQFAKQLGDAGASPATVLAFAGCGTATPATHTSISNAKIVPFFATSPGGSTGLPRVT